MNIKKISCVSLTLVCTSFISQAFAADKHPLIVKKLERFSLADQNKAMAGYDIRARRIVVPAGTKIEEHEHSTRAGIVYVESGSIIEYRGKKSRVMHAGDSLVEDVNTVHAYENVSQEDCVLIAFDLPTSSN